jgi:DNA-binding response OmpR family regulator
MIVLVVEDDLDTRDIVNLTLSSRGYAVKSTESLYGALDILKQVKNEPIGMILLDWNLPGMPMNEFLREVRNVQPNVPIVLSTAAYRAKEKAIQCGLKWWLPKPIFPEELIAMVEHLSKGQPDSANSVSA